MRYVRMMTMASVLASGAGCLLDDGGVVGDQETDAAVADATNVGTSHGSGSGAMGTSHGSGSGTTVGSSDRGSSASTGPGSGTGSGTTGPGSGTGPLSSDAGSDGGAVAPVTVTCASVDLAVLTFDAAPTELLVTAVLTIGDTVSPGVDATLTSVDILSGTTVVDHLTGSGQFAIGTSQLVAAEINPPTGVSQQCASDAPADRFDFFSVALTGSLVSTGAPFSVTCSSQGVGAPPTVVETCQKNFDYPPLIVEANVTEGSAGQSSAVTEVQSETSIGTGGAIQSVASSLFVIPTDTTIQPEAVPGWETANASVVMEMNQPPFNVIELETSGTPFGGLCGFDAGLTPAFFIVRFTGENGYGAFSAEGIVQLCGVESQ